MEIKVDLFSDTGTRPGREMRKFMAEAEVGDEQLREDPSVNCLNRMAAEILGKDDAIYLPSGIMANQISFAVHCSSGDEIIMDKTAHPIHYEAGGTAVISGASINPVSGNRGIYTLEQVKEAVRSEDYHDPQTRLISIENTSNLGGGTIWPLEEIKKVTDFAHENGFAVHMDGARLLNAVAATGISAKKYAANLDSVWIDLSKGLGAPVGSVLAGSSEFIEKAHYWKKRLGGSMRQAGIIAAGGIYALENNRERLKEDNENAKMLAEGMAAIDEIDINPEHVETNIIFFKLNNYSADEAAELFLKEGVRFSRLKNYLRAVTHLGVDRDDMEYVLDVMNRVL